MSYPRRFPAVTPTSRRFTAGRRPETRFESQNGATVFVAFGNRQVNATLELTFANLPDNEAAQILDHYQSVLVDDFVVFTKGHGLGGMSETLRNAIPQGDNALRYRYTEPPELTSVYPGVSTVVCKFTGYLFGE
jgi:hypothetical protein